MDAALPDEDLEHPIPRLYTIDVHGVRQDAGSDLVVVVAAPLRADEYSLKRLDQEINNYIAAVGSNGYAAQYGRPDPKNTSIVIYLHTASDPSIRDHLEQYKSKAMEAGAAFCVKPFDPNAMEGQSSGEA